MRSMGTGEIDLINPTSATSDLEMEEWAKVWVRNLTTWFTGYMEVNGEFMQNLAVKWASHIRETKLEQEEVRYEQQAKRAHLIGGVENARK